MATLGNSCGNQIITEPMYRCSGCYKNMASNDPATQYYRQKIIQNTVRVKSSLYTMNLGALSTYQKPKSNYGIVDVSGNTYVVSPGVNWNQMSDRREPHVQQFRSGSNSSRVWRKTGPGALSPGGSGVDIKHNSYERYLNRLKGKAPLRRGIAPPNFGVPEIPFTLVKPVYGGKVMKMSIVNDCNCSENETLTNQLIKDSNIQDKINDVIFTYQNIESAPGTTRTRDCEENIESSATLNSLYIVNYSNSQSIYSNDRNSFFNPGT